MTHIMANTLSTPHWPEIRLLAEQGVPLPVLAERFNLAVNTIYNKSASEDWLTPSRVKNKVSRLSIKHIPENGDSPLLGGGSLSEKAESLIHETWETRASDLRNLAYGVAVQAIRESKGQIVIESASDLKHAVHVARQATGLLDTDAPQIQLSLFGNGDICGPSVMGGMVESCEPLQELPEVADFWD